MEGPLFAARLKRLRGFFHIDIAEVQTAEGKLDLSVGIDRTSKFAVTQLVDKTNRRTAWFIVDPIHQMPGLNT